jgi:colanic acid/amylovoran biosynthesis glycosyltransferase
MALILLLRVMVLFCRVPLRASSFLQLERQSGRSWNQALENLYLSSHILTVDIDWLHFGFATMAIRKENTAKAMHAKMAVSLRGFDIAIYPVKNTGCYNLLWKRIDKLHTISDDLLALAYSNGLPTTTPYQKITPAIDIKKFTRTTPIHEKLGQPIRLLTVARLHWKKGLEYTLEALAGLKKSGIDFQYTIIGSGEEYERLIFAEHQYGIKEQVDFAGKMTHEEVKSELEDTDIYIQYSISEGFCNAVLEAQAMGCLCVVSDAEGLSENVVHGETGWVVPKRNPTLLARQIIDIIQTEGTQLKKIREAAINRVAEKFNLEQQKEAFVEFYLRDSR